MSCQPQPCHPCPCPGQSAMATTFPRSVNTCTTGKLRDCVALINASRCGKRSFTIEIDDCSMSVVLGGLKTVSRGSLKVYSDDLQALGTALNATRPISALVRPCPCPLVHTYLRLVTCNYPDDNRSRWHILGCNTRFICRSHVSPPLSSSSPPNTTTPHTPYWTQLSYRPTT
jgi:hypothetical protein